MSMRAPQSLSTGSGVLSAAARNHSWLVCSCYRFSGQVGNKGE